MLLPTVLLTLPFSFKAALTLHGLQPVIVWLLVFALIVLARFGRWVLVPLFVGQIGLQLALLGVQGWALDVTFSRPAAFYRLLDQRAEVRDAPQPVNFNVPIEVAGVSRAVIWSAPPAALIYSRIALPADRGSRLRAWIAIHPLVWPDRGGDGARFALEIRSGDGQPAQRIWSAYVNPAHREEDRAWLPVDVPLTPFRGQTVDLVLVNEAGPDGNAYADWCLWADPELVLDDR